MQTTGLKGAPLSQQQNRLWSFQQGNTAYRVQGAVWLQGELHGIAFQQALQEKIEQYEILQTVFHTFAGMDAPVQVIGRRPPFSCPVVSLEEFPLPMQHALLNATCDQLQTLPFDLAHGPIVLATVFRLSIESHLLLLCFPALCADASTLPLFVAEVIQKYEASSSGNSLEEEPLQYSAVSAWQDELRESESANLPRDFWNRIDLEQATLLQLPFGSAGCASNDDLVLARQIAFKPDSLPIVLDEEQTSRICSNADTYNVPVSALLLACWQVALWRVLDESSLVMGVACDGRDQEDLATILGPHTRFVPVGLSFGEHWTFAQVIATVSQSLQTAIKWQSYFIWNEQSEQKGSNYFSVVFEHQTWPTTIKSGTLDVSLYRSSNCTEPFVIKLRVMQIEKQLHLELHYDPRWFSNEHASRLRAVLHALMQGAMEHPHARVRDLPLVDAMEQERLIQLFQSPRQPLPTSGFHQLFEKQAWRAPLQVAILSVNEQLTYQELNSRANQLARILRRLGIGPGVPVGLCLPRAVQAIVAMLAIFKAGGAYVPLDPEHPPAKLVYQLQDVQPALLLTEQEFLPRLSQFDGHVVNIKTLWLEAAQEDTSNLSIPCEPGNPAYVIYTSGSTGVPKGVMIQQGSVVNYTRAFCDLLRPEAGWHFATVSTLSADLGNTAIFCALASGGCLQILDYTIVTSTEAFARWAEQHPIDVLKIVPSHLSALLIGEHGRRVLPRKVLLLGGEVLPGALLERIQDQGATCEVYNHYGPTETTIGVLVNKLEMQDYSETARDSSASSQAVPLGRPIANTDVYVLDHSLQVVPVGVMGELYIAGAGLAEGYLHQPEQTSERFVPHPFSERSGDRLYRTGDLVCCTEQGQIEFVGRRDGQVKLRGYRIELGEIEAVLRQHNNVWDSAVLLRDDVGGSLQLVGYIVARKQPGPTNEELCDFLRKHVPEYMIPSLFMLLKVLPLTANGKVDRRQLPRPEVNLNETRSVLTMPRGPIEEILVTIWEDLLVVPEVGVHDNFFQMGGHSLLATQVISRMRIAMQVELSIQSLFENPTIAELARQVEHILRDMPAEQVPPLLPAERVALLPLSFAQQRLWFLDQLEPGSIAYLIPRARRIYGVLNAAILERSLGEIVRRHEDLRTSFQEQAGQPVQVIHLAGTFLLPVVDLCGLSQDEREHEARQLAKQEAQRPCDLVQGPLLRTYLLVLDAQEHVFLLTMHHIISDGWSNDVFERELLTLYQAFIMGKPSPLSPLSIQYADFALWQRRWLQGEILEAQLAYWRHQLADASSLDLPIDHPRPPMQTFQGAFLAVHFPVTLQEEIIALSQREGVTLFMLLLAAFQMLLMRYTGQNDISVGTPIANRTHAELEGLIGFFVNTLVLRTDLSDNPSFTEVLRRVRKVALEAYTHQDVPFEQLIEALQPARDLSRSPLFQAMFVLQDVSPITTNWEGLLSSELGVEHRISKFDLTLNVVSNMDGLYCGIEYNTNLFEAKTIELMLVHWKTLLQNIVAMPHMPLLDLPLLTAEERHQLLVEWNSPEADFLPELYVHNFFERQAKDTPDIVALVCEDAHLTYSQLNDRANQLANMLRQLGVGSEVIVGIALERSFLLCIALLGVLKAGGAYVPLDPSYPAERLSFMLQDARVMVLLTQSGLREQLAFHHIPVLYLDSDWPSVARHTTEKPVVADCHIHNLAYIIYTSGSTGLPKGCMISHGSLAQCIQTMVTLFGLQPGHRQAQFVSVSFDVLGEEIFPALSSGATVVLLPHPGETPLTEFLQLCGQLGVSKMDLPASYWHRAIDALVTAGQSAPDSLSLLVVGGESPSVEKMKIWKELIRQPMRLFNAYGTTETTILATTYILELTGEQQASWEERVPLGRPLPLTQAYVLDEQGQPVPIGVRGELYLGGTGLARGYLKQPELTAQRFVPNPFTTQLGSRLYRTGDQVRYLPDGNLEFLGRVDQQIKLRGYRIEPREIETLLVQYPTIETCVVLIREDASGEKRLVAYAASKESGRTLDSRELRSYLQKTLPAYMIPASIVLLKELPLTPNGKIDQRALPVPEIEQSEESGEVVVPLTPMEELLAGIWSKVLVHSRVNIHDNFFELGGHSLLATQLVSRIRGLFEVEVPLRSLFEAPTIAGLARRVEQIVRGGQHLEELPLCPVTRSQEFPLSFAQQRLWFLEQLEPGSITYLMPNAWNLQGVLDIRSLERSLEAMVYRHESLRTIFQERMGEPPVQVMQQAVRFYLPVVDLRGLVSAVRESEAQQLAEQETQHPCNLTQGPLLRVCLLLLDDAEQVLLWTMHHIISDGWSMQVFERELRILYQAFTAGKPSPLSPLPIQYADFALWQRQWLQGEVLETQLTYWRKQLADVPALELPTDHPRPPQQTFQGNFCSLLLPPLLQQDLIVLSQQEEVTLFMLLLATFQVLLSRYSGQYDITVGTPIANRTRAELEGLIGFFVNTLVLRNNLSGNPTFAGFLKQVRESALGAYSHQELPFEQLVDVLQPERDPSRAPLFQVMFSMQQMQETDELGEMQVKEMHTGRTISKFDLTLHVVSDMHGLRCGIEYNTDLFEMESIQRLLGYWQNLLQGVVTDPQTRLADLPLLSAMERHQLLVEWNATRTDVLSEICIHDLFEQQAMNIPDRIALVWEDTYLSYAELNRRADYLASHLQHLGVRREELIGLCVERSPEMLVGLLGILKAGCAYVPLDPAYPAERLAFIVADAQLAVVLTQERVIAQVPALGQQNICLDRDWETFVTESSTPFIETVAAEQKAYVIYTSGSTGAPKGVMVSHRNVTNFFTGMDRQIGCEPVGIWLAVTSLSFDISVLELLWTLTRGFRVIVQTALVIESQDYSLATQIVKHDVTHLQCTPSLARMLLLMPETANALKRLQNLLLGGEALPLSLMKQLCDVTTAALHNMYGPTETTIWSTTHHLEQSEHIVSLGRPIANTQIYLLDTSLQPVPIGGTGEIYIGGAGVARGYYQRPALTAERFIPHPYGDEAGARLYKTGDIARHYPDGRLEYLGRADQQVKIRGHRIELGEIESVLELCPSLREVVLVVRENDTGGKHLVAFMVSREPIAPSVEELRNYVKDRLPEPMIPSHFVFLDTLPLTPNGKVDRRALPDLSTLTSERSEPIVAPRTPIEKAIAEIWGTILEKESVSIDDNFFEQGGHSLLATQLVSRIRTALNVELPLRSLFESPTVTGLAEGVEQLLHGEAGTQVPPIVVVSRQQELPLSFAQQRFWFIDQLEPDNDAYSIPRFARIAGKIDISALLRSFEEIIRRHEVLRTRFETHAGKPRQIIGEPIIFPWQVIDLRALDHQTREQKLYPLIQSEMQLPFSLERGPLLRLRLVRLDEEEMIFLLNIHHIICDAWSMEKLIDELTRVYTAFSSGQPSPLLPLPLQYADFAVWQRQWLQGEVLDQQLAYWHQQLHGVTVLNLPTDHLRPPVQTFRGASQFLVLPNELLDQLFTLARREGVTLFMLLLAAFQVLLLRYTGQDDIALGTLIANRTHTELERLIGFFANTLVLRTDLSGNPTFRELLLRVREVALGAYAHQDVPFERLVTMLQPERDLSRTPLFQVLLLMPNVPRSSETTEGIAVSSVILQQDTTLHDLILGLTPAREGLRCKVEYNTNLFEAETIQRLIGHWQTLLASVVAHPEYQLTDLPLLSDQERQRLLTIWNATDTPRPARHAFHELFSEQAWRTPDAIALLDADSQLTYQKVDSLSLLLAQQLHRLGVGPETLVGLYLDRGLDLVLCMLATFKAGGAYIPLDPAYPAARLVSILEDARPLVVVTSSALRPVLLTWPGAIVSLLPDWYMHSEMDAALPLPELLSGQQLAYIIYTSGSTGSPKGAMITHQGMLNHLYAKIEALHLNSVDCVAQSASHCFDISVWQALTVLLVGGRVEIISEEVVHDPARLLSHIATTGVSVLEVVPSLLQVLLNEEKDDVTENSTLSLRWLVVTGEAFSSTLGQRWLSRYPQIPLMNAYGPTECSDDVTHHVVTSLPPTDRPSIPIGRALANTQLYILDSRLEPVPMGVPGQLYVGGIGVGRGYLHNAWRTAETFLPDPFAQQQGMRLYYTGDQVRYLADGCIEFLGRLDEQVKVRGYRIELGEIEAVLNQYPDVCESVAVVREEATGDQRIVAYIVPQQHSVLAFETLRAYLREHLPTYMIPAQLLELERLPLTPSGKVDRKALPLPSEALMQQIEQAPGSLIEELLASLWAGVLRVPHINRHDNFFEQGGHSLLATQLISRVRTTLNVELPLRSLFEFPTVAGLAERVELLLHSKEGVEPPPIVAVSLQQDLPLSFAQQRLWFLDQLEPGSIAYLMPNVHRFQEALDVRALERSLEEVIQRHASLRTTLRVYEDQPVQVIHQATPFRLPIIDLSQLDVREREARRLIEQEAQRPCDLVQGPLLRMFLLRLHCEEQVLLWTMHHIISDAWSMQIFEREVITFYQAFAFDQPSPLPPLPIQYADFVLWQRQWLQGEVLEAQLDYWITHLSGAPTLELPIDHPHPPMQSPHGAIHSFILSGELSQALLSLSHQEGITLFMLLLAAFQVLLYRYTGQRDIVVGTDSANRNRVELEGIIGFFVNLLALRTDLSGNPSFQEVLHRVREIVLGAYVHQETPFELLVEKLAPTRTLERMPLVQALLVLQNLSPLQATQRAMVDFTEQEESALNHLEVEATTVKFDLALFVREDGGQLYGKLNYSVDLFEASTIATMAARFETILQSIVHHPGALIDSLDFLTETEQLQNQREGEALKQRLRVHKGKRFDLPE